MKNTLVLFILIFISLPLYGVAKFSDRYFAAGCSLYNYQGVLIKNFPGSICVYLEDGRVVSGTDKMIRLISPDREILWEKNGNYHHQINLSPDGKRIYALSSEVREEKGTSVRYDWFVIFDLDGNVLAENSIRHLEKDFLDNNISLFFQDLFQNTTKERSHFNSIFEIGDVKVNPAVPAIAKGNVIVNSLFLGVYILSPDLKKVLHHFMIPGSAGHLVHDVQILSDGNILIFNNESNPVDAPYHSSALQILDPVSLKSIYSFSGEKGIPLYSSHCGGAQKLDEEFFLYSHMVNGAYIFSRKTGKIVKSIFEPNVIFGRTNPVQNLRLVKLSPTFISKHLSGKQGRD
ncbi:MAG: hypothetical protein V4598_11870 [Bdellovibrionota bacterium]